MNKNLNDILISHFPNLYEKFSLDELIESENTNYEVFLDKLEKVFCEKIQCREGKCLQQRVFYINIVRKDTQEIVYVEKFKKFSIKKSFFEAVLRKKTKWTVFFQNLKNYFDSKDKHLYEIYIFFPLSDDKEVDNIIKTIHNKIEYRLHKLKNYGSFKDTIEKSNFLSLFIWLTSISTLLFMLLVENEFYKYGFSSKNIDYNLMLLSSKSFLFYLVLLMMGGIILFIMGFLIFEEFKSEVITYSKIVFSISIICILCYLIYFGLFSKEKNTFFASIIEIYVESSKSFVCKEITMQNNSKLDTLLVNYQDSKYYYYNLGEDYNQSLCDKNNRKKLFKSLNSKNQDIQSIHINFIKNISEINKKGHK